MSFQVTSQYFDKASGMHVAKLRNEHDIEHIVQIAVSHDACPACGHVHLKSDTGSLDPRAMIAAVIADLDASHAQMDAYIAQHKLTVK